MSQPPPPVPPLPPALSNVAKSMLLHRASDASAAPAAAAAAGSIASSATFAAAAAPSLPIMSPASAVGVSSSTSDGSDDFDWTPMAVGELKLPFYLGDVDRLCEIEIRVQQRRKGLLPSSPAHNNNQNGPQLNMPVSPANSESSRQSVISPSLLHPDELERWSGKIDILSELLSDASSGSDEQWTAVTLQHEAALLRGLVLLVSYVPLPPATFHSLLQSLYLLSTISPPSLYEMFTQHCRGLDKLLSSIMPELERDALLARLRIIDMVLTENYSQRLNSAREALKAGQGEEGVSPLAEALQSTETVLSFEDVQQELLECLATPSPAVFSLAVVDMLLLNTLDQKRSLHRIIMTKQAELSTSPMGTSSSASSSILSPNSNLTTSVLSQFSQELITLVNAGRLPSGWVEPAEQSEVHSGVDHHRKASMVDMYESVRVQVQGLPDRDPTCHAVTSAALAFLQEIFYQNTALDLMYTNDISVLVEVILRRMEDQLTSQDLLVLSLDFLMTLSAVIAWPEFAQRPIKVSEIRALCKSILTEYQEREVTPEMTNALSPVQLEQIDTTNAIVQLTQLTLKKLDSLS